MKLKEKIRDIWHDLYYFFASDRAVQFAMTCKEFAQQVDLKLTQNLKNQFRFLLHMSLCQGCKNYFSLSQALKVAIQTVIFKKEKADRLVKLNQELLLKHSINQNSKT